MRSASGTSTPELLIGVLRESQQALSLGQIERRMREIGWSGTARDLVDAIEPLRREGRVSSPYPRSWQFVPDSANTTDNPQTKVLDHARDGAWWKLRQLIKYYVDAVDAEHRAGVAFWAEDEGRKWLRWPLTTRWLPDRGGEQRIRLESWMGGMMNALVNGGEELTLVFGYPILIRRIIQRKTGEESTLLVPAVVWEVTWRIEGEWLVLTSAKGEQGWLNSDWADEFLPKSNAKEWMDTLIDGVPLPERSEVLLGGITSLIPPGRWADEPSTRLIKLLPASPKDWMQGVYPAGLIGIATASKFTRGLEQELRWIAQNATDHDFDASALSVVFGSLRNPEASSAATNEPDMASQLRGVFVPSDRPLNREQLLAVRDALKKAVSLVIGPPGTGKTDVAAAVGLNAALQHQSVLICSRNNVAVEEVEKRLRDIGDSLISEVREGSSVPLVHRAGSSWGGKNYVTGNEALRRAVPHAHRALSKTQTTTDSSGPPAILSHPLLIQQSKLLQDWSQVEKDFVDLQQHQRVCQSLAYPEIYDETADYQWVQKIDFSLINKCLNTLETHSNLLKLLSRLPLSSLWNFLYKRVFGQKLRAIQSKLESILCHKEEKQDYSTALGGLRKRAKYAKALYELLRTQADLLTLPTSPQLIHRASQIQSQLQDELKRVGPAWFQARVSRLSAAERASLARLKELLTIGEGKGLKQTDKKKLEQELRQFSPMLTRLLPVWCCTNLSLRKRLPLSPGVFDLALIDEASQCDPASAIPILFRAKRVAAIGDNNQLRHTTRLSEEDDGRLFASRDLGADEAGYLYTKFSFFDLVEKAVTRDASAGVVHQLLLHYRCTEEIIGFSSEEFYGGSLEVMTDEAKARTPSAVRPGIFWSNVRGTIEKGDTGSVSDTEAVECVRVFKQVIRDPMFGGSVGIVTPFRQQANRIRQRLEQEVSVETLEKHRVAVDTAHAFQGGQRDVIIMSLMYAEEMPGGSKLFLDREPNLFNVAISRAASVLWIVGDLDAARECTIGHIRRFAQYYEGLALKRRSPRQPPMSSVWESRLQKSLEEAGVVTVAQYPADKYFVDLAYTENGCRLAIEVDGEAYHLDERGRRLTSDIARDLRLRGLGWTVIRFWVWQVRDEPATCVQKVKAHISEASNEKEGIKT